MRASSRFFELSNDLFLTAAPDGVIVDVNPAWTATLGWSRAELVGIPFIDLVHPDDVEAAGAEAGRLAASPTITVGFENRYATKGGEHRWLLWSARSDEDHMIYAVAKDITQRRADEEAVRTRERTWRSLIDANVIGIIVADTAGRVWEANEAFCHMVGWTQDDVLSGAVRWDSLTPPGWEAVDAAKIESLLSVGSFGNLEKEYLHRDGGAVPVLIGGAMIDDAAGKYVCTVLDLTDAKEARAEILRLNATLEDRIVERTSLLELVQESQSRFIVAGNGSRIFDDLLESVLELTRSEHGFIHELVHDADRTPHLRVRALTNLPWDDEASTLYRRFLDGSETLDNMSSLFGAVVTTGEAVISNDARHDPRGAGVPSGHPELEAFLGVPLRANGELMGMIGLGNRIGGYDETIVAYLEPIATACANILWAERNDAQRRMTEAALVASNDALSRANAELEAFTYSVSHDLRAPLRAMSGFANVLINEATSSLPDQHRHYLRRIAENAQRMGVLIDDLLTLSRLGRQALTITRVAPRPLVEQMLETFAADLAGRDVEVTIGDLPPCEADRQLLGLVFQNLLGNAIKFTSHQTFAHIDVSGVVGPGDGVTYVVRDDGVGFDPTYADKLFQVFQRLHSSDEFEGTGVGLAIVDRIVRRHGGTVAAQSTTGHGATFTFTIPEGSHV